ncbi:MAG: GatB/YqeY domain-containing protein [Patescibacteria group bacterium]
MLKQQIQSDSTNALKQGNQEVAGVLRMVLASINSKEKEKRYKISKEKANLKEEELVKESQLTDEEIISVLSSEIKKRKDAIALYEKGNRQELADKEKKEIEIIQKYLPEQLSQDVLRKIIEESIKKVGAKELKDMRKIMADLMPKVKGKADNSEISKMVKELLVK